MKVYSLEKFYFGKQREETNWTMKAGELETIQSSMKKMIKYLEELNVPLTGGNGWEYNLFPYETWIKTESICNYDRKIIYQVKEWEW